MADRQPEELDTEWQIHWGRLLRTARQVAGLSLSQLSAASGLSKGYLSKLESGHVAALNPSRATLAALARALPSFRAIAHTLEPASDLDALAFRHTSADVSHLLLSPPGDRAEPPIVLGWRELEVITAVLTLERAAAAQPLSASVVARALGRPHAAVELVLEHLAGIQVLRRRPPVRMGAPVTYQCAEDFEARVGIHRAGDALVLAAALLGQARPLARPASTRGEQYRLGRDTDETPSGFDRGEQ